MTTAVQPHSRRRSHSPCLGHADPRHGPAKAWKGPDHAFSTWGCRLQRLRPARRLQRGVHRRHDAMDGGQDSRLRLLHRVPGERRRRAGPGSIECAWSMRLRHSYDWPVRQVALQGKRRRCLGNLACDPHGGSRQPRSWLLWRHRAVSARLRRRPGRRPRRPSRRPPLGRRARQTRRRPPDPPRVPHPRRLTSWAAGRPTGRSPTSSDVSAHGRSPSSGTSRPLGGLAGPATASRPSGSRTGRVCRPSCGYGPVQPPAASPRRTASGCSSLPRSPGRCRSHPTGG